MKKNITIVILVIVSVLFFIYTVTQEFKVKMHATIAKEATGMLKSCEQETTRLSEELESARNKIDDLQLKIEECK